MCGRFTLAYEDWSFMLDYWDVANRDFAHPPRYNIAPMQDVPAIISDGRERRIGLLRWGLIPSWAKDPRIASRTINARAETLLEKPSFQRLVARKRCLIPADGFYEWKEENKRKVPMRIVLTDRPVFGFAGLYDTWVSPAGQRVHTCTIITTCANGSLAAIHPRMPVILTREAESAWLNPAIQDGGELATLLQPYPAEHTRAYPVSPAVGNVRNDVPECIRELV